MSDLTPHGFCLAWNPLLLRLHVVSDAAIALSYYSIPLALIVFLLRRRDVGFGWLFGLFATFILACGTTHALDIWTLWVPDYAVQGGVKAVTAVASVLTAGLLWWLMPRALALPSPAMLRAANDRLRETVAEREAAFANLQREMAERQRTEEMLRQSQKLQAIGQLTGGVAHDFNNRLMVIQGSLEVLRMQSVGAPGLERQVERSLRSVRQASALTQQLLAFARKQPLQPVTVNLNERVRALSSLLPTTLGPEIKIDLRLAEDLWLAEADPNQLESGLLNIVINARDAMPSGGTVTVTTGNERLTATQLEAMHADRDEELEAGDYVTLTVADTGTGMTPEVRDRAFEPFFTTKSVGNGTGLGLSQIYGFVRQLRGQVTLSSEPDRGTRITIYLRRSAAEAAQPHPGDTADAAITAGIQASVASS